MNPLYCGIDLHANNSVLALVDQDGKRHGHRKLTNDRDRILAFLEDQDAPIAKLTVESTYNWYWLADTLEAAGYSLELANPNAIDQYDGLKAPGDTHDAYHLAELLRLDILPTGHICPRDERPLRDLMRRRQLLVQQRTGLQLSVQNLFARETGRQTSWRTAAKLEPELQRELLDDELLHATVQRQRGLINCLDAAIRDFERWAEARLKERPEYALLRTAPGIGAILAATIMLETGPIERFARHANYVSYCRLTDAKATSNGKTKHRQNRKNGNRYLSWAYAEAATLGRRFSEPVRRWYQRKLARCGNKAPLASKALAAKYAKACYYVLKNQEPFDLGRAFG